MWSMSLMSWVANDAGMLQKKTNPICAQNILLYNTYVKILKTRLLMHNS